MAIEKRTYKSVISYRAYWRNPYTKKIERGEARATRKEAEADDDKVKYRLKYDLESFIPETLGKPATMELCVGDLFPMHLQRADISESTRKHDFYHLRPINKFLGAKPVGKLTSDDLKAFEKKEIAAGRKQNTIHRRIALLRLVLNWAAEEKLITHNPVAGYRSKRGEDKRIPPPTPREICLLLNVSPPHLRRAIILSYYLGVRVGESELLKLHWDNFELERRRIRVWSAKKNKRMPWRDISLVDSLYAIMMEWYMADSGSGYIITYKGNPIKAIKRSYKSAFSKLWKMGLLPENRYFRPYDMRHAFGTETLAAGADPGAVASMMGHRDTTMLRHHYQHVLDAQKQQVVEAVPDVLGGIPSRDTNAPFFTPFSYPDDNLKQ